MNKLRKFLQTRPWLECGLILIGIISLGIVVYTARKNSVRLSVEEFKEFMREVQLLSLIWR